MMYGVVVRGTTQVITLNDKDRTHCLFESEVRAYKIRNRMNTQSEQHAYMNRYDVLPVDMDAAGTQEPHV